MRQLYIKTTESCNLKCKHCYINDARSCNRIFDCEKTIRWVDKYLRTFKISSNDIVIAFHGGEPFKAPIELLERVCQAFPQYRFSATSNLVFSLADRQINLIKKYFKDLDGKPFIKTSWDYKIRFENDNQSNLWEANVKNLLALGIDVHVTVCLTSLLIDQVSQFDLLEKFHNLGVSSINFERLTTNTTVDKSLIPDYVLQDRWLSNLYVTNKDTFNLNILMFDTIEKAIVENALFGCSQRKCMEKVITINADGSIGGCPNSSLVQPFSSIDKDPTDLIKNACRQCLIDKENIRNSKCNLCELFPYCNGDCHQLSFQNGVCPAPITVYKHILKQQADKIEYKDPLFVDLEDLIVNQFEKDQSLLPPMELESFDLSAGGDLSTLINTCKTEIISVDMDQAYNVSNLLFLKDPTDVTVILNKINKIFYVPGFYKRILSDNPDKKFDLNTKIIDKATPDIPQPDFDIPKVVNYKKFSALAYGNIQLGGEQVFYYCLNLPAEYYLTHYKEYDHLLYDLQKKQFLSSNKDFSTVQYLINSIATEGFRNPLIFKINNNGLLKGICNSTRLMIARLLQLPTIPAVIVLSPSNTFVNSNTGDYRDLAEKYLSPYIILPENCQNTDILAQYTQPGKQAYERFSKIPQEIQNMIITNYLIKLADIKFQQNSCKGLIFNDGSYLIWSEIYHDYLYHLMGLSIDYVETNVAKITDIVGKTTVTMPKEVTRFHTNTLHKLRKLTDIEVEGNFPISYWALA